VKHWNIARYAIISCIAAAPLADCSASQALVGGAPQGVVPSTRSAAHSQGSPTYKVLFSFGSNVYGLDGADPAAGLIDVSGSFYGTTAYGGASTGYNGGTVFSISTTGKESVLHSFGNGSDGGQPLGGLVDVNGTLYGTTAFGGTYNNGTVFSITTAGDEKVLYSFGGSTDGSNARAGLVAVKGVLYGTTYQGGTSGEGTVFAVRISDGKETVLHSFSGAPDGSYPLASLLNVNGTLYGTTLDGGSRYGAGTIFSINTAGVEAVLLSFDGPDGAYPYAGLINVGGTLYGTTGGGGTGSSGTVFSIDKSGMNERVLHNFGNSASDGIAPLAGLISVKGTLYGTTSEGGAAAAGTVFRLKIDGTKERVLHSFGEHYKNDGSLPKANLLRVNNTLYGTTVAGGISLPSCYNYGMCDYGTVFALTP
jgi:uncharacterized repeat protein (TIGR03803 family)